MLGGNKWSLTLHIPLVNTDPNIKCKNFWTKQDMANPNNLLLTEILSFKVHHPKWM